MQSMKQSQGAISQMEAVRNSIQIVIELLTASAEAMTANYTLCLPAEVLHEMDKIARFPHYRKTLEDIRCEMAHYVEHDDDKLQEQIGKELKQVLKDAVSNAS